MTACGYAVWGQSAAIEQTKLCRGLCGMIGIWGIELRGRNSFSQVVSPPVNILARPDPKHDII